MKTCTKCGEAKALDDFHRDKRKADGRRFRCKACENVWQLEFQRKHKAETGEYYSRRYVYERTCEVCGTTWQSRNKVARYCSLSCINKARSYDRTCENCAAPFTSAQYRARWCSPRCSAQHFAVAREQAERERQATAWLPTIRDWPHGRAWCLVPDGHPAMQPALGPRLFVQGNCIRCGVPFCVHSEAGIASYCSPRCQRSDGKARRRAIKRDAYVAHVYRIRIFERDKWTCRLCGKKTRQDKTVPHPLAPVIDHIVPLSKGGTHEPANTQCAHFLCNSIKSDRGGGEQLMLIG